MCLGASSTGLLIMLADLVISTKIPQMYEFLPFLLKLRSHFDSKNMKSGLKCCQGYQRKLGGQFG